MNRLVSKLVVVLIFIIVAFFLPDGFISRCTPFIAEGIYIDAFGEIQVLAEFESSIFDEV